MNIAESELALSGIIISPPYILAPMAGVTHSAFRRLVADIGGYGALFTEMLSGTALYSENTATSPFTKRRDHEGQVMYQLRLTGTEDFAKIAAALSRINPFGIDINCGCPAPEIRKAGAGIELFDDFERLKFVVSSFRDLWPGIVTVKCRLGKPRQDWKEPFAERLKLFESIGVDAVTVHPRFSDEKLKRIARKELYPWICSCTKLPIIANGDITTPPEARELLRTSGCKGVMIGRMAAIRPWIFRDCTGEQPANPDYCEIWTRFFDYTCEDFQLTKAIGRIKEFTAYYARNFLFGHELYRGVQGAPDLATLKTRATVFLSACPVTVKEPSVMGI